MGQRVANASSTGKEITACAGWVEDMAQVGSSSTCCPGSPVPVRTENMQLRLSPQVPTPKAHNGRAFDLAEQQQDLAKATKAQQ